MADMDDLAKVLYPDRPRTERHRWGKAVSKNPSGTWQVSLSPGTSVECAAPKGVSLSANDRVLVLVTASGKSAIIAAY